MRIQGLFDYPRAFLVLASCALGLTLGVAGCGQGGVSAPLLGDQVTPAEATPANLPGAERARIVTVHVALRVDDVERSIEAVRALVTAHEGYVQEASTQQVHGASGQFHVRVPTGQLVQFRSAVADLGQVASDRESAVDVTSERADLSARLRNARAEEARLLGLLAERTGGLADVLAVEAELSRVRESVERMVAQERVLTRDVGYANVHLDIAPRRIAFSDEPGRSIAAAATEGLEVAWTVLVGIVVMVVAAAPTALLLLALLVALIRSVRLLLRLRRRWSPAT